MKFVLNKALITAEPVTASTTVLQYLRSEQKSLGTKEGCASGDCGACTCMVGERVDGGMRYHTINSCITPLGALEGKHLVTVEHLADGDQRHPVQQAMVDYHGSQCGFCTPGFVMSLTSLHASCSAAAPASRQQVVDAVAGNLCRCTGYRPIVDAGLAACAERARPLYDEQTLSLLDAIDEPQSLHYFAPTTLSEWCEFKNQYPDAPNIAGGTDLMLESTLRYRDFAELIDLTHIRELQAFKINDDTLVLGAGLTYSQVEEKAAAVFPALAHFLQRVASPQIRNRGTLGGNIANASPIADMPPIFLALDASVEIMNSAYQRRSVPLDDFYLAYKKTRLATDELLINIRIPRPALSGFHRFYKISKRYEDDISTVMAAIRFRLEHATIADARIAFGGMAAVPLRVSSAETHLIGKLITDEAAIDAAVAAIMNELSPLSDVRASAGYRKQMAANLLRKAWLEAGGTALPGLFEGSAHA